jgi:hypothetical protein
MALPPKFKGHRLTFTDSATASPSNEPLHTLEIYLDYVCPFSASQSAAPLSSLLPPIPAQPKINLLTTQPI